MIVSMSVHVSSDPISFRSLCEVELCFPQVQQIRRTESSKKRTFLRLPAAEEVRVTLKPKLLQATRYGHK